ncbi:MAG: Tim44/TimA family putative adaptor protein [Holosporales bacterium]|jgi:predicted lipid-binding transport protein (Tim44 family)|nr:Tim44/TimA family putative adaptor protein [Holosporales bacterium]
MVSFIFLAAVVVLLLIRLNEVMGIKPASKSKGEFSHTDDDSNIIEVEATEVDSSDDVDGKPQENDEVRIHGRKFDKLSFLRGAEKALMAIDKAFNDGHENKLRQLLNGEILDSFLKSIQERKRRKETLESLLLSVKKAEVLDLAHVKSNVVVSVLFELEQTKILKNQDGEIIDGDVEYVKTIKRIWHFEQPITASSTQWKLTAISDAQ